VALQHECRGRNLAPGCRSKEVGSLLQSFHADSRSGRRGLRRSAFCGRASAVH
jgi:hypothetical protein